MSLLYARKIFFLFTLIPLIAGCKKEGSETELAIQQQATTNAKPAPPAPNPVPAIAVTDCNYNPDNSLLTNAGWTLLFEDNFNDPGLPNWKIWTGGAFNNELQYYQPQNLTVSGGVLTITANKETVTGATTPFDPTSKTFNYTSGRIESIPTVSANTTTPKVRMMARIKLANGYGMWPAFWSYGDPWPTQGEIDMVEARGHEPNKYQTNYFYGKQPNRNLVRNATGYITADTDLTTCYHVYEMVWERDKLTSYLDGQVVEVKTSGGYITSLFGKSERITLNLAVGGDFFSNLDASKITTGTMHIDWVKVFTSK